ncbi:hypothetical protein FQR65_LT13823 [Abscondita terminalis]|nr:hypothetical protein FQR65_LT13823 [Abscondita terminalis]
MQSNRVSSKRYKYTKDNVYLTDEQRDFYEKNGYIVFRNLVDWDILDECKQRFIDVCNNNSDAAVMIVMKDTHLKSKNVKGEFVINKIQDFLYDEVFFKYVSCKPMVDVIQSIIGPNISGVHSMLINKPPDSTKDSSRHPLHQDLHYFPFRPADSVVASWTAMETVNEQNGCLFVVPGSHKGELMKHEYPPNVTNKAYHGVLGVDHLPTVNLTMEKGDTVFFHPILLHGSGHNLTKGFRKAISCHYADSNCHFIDVRGTLQEEIEREVLEMAEKRGFGHANFQTIWKAKSRLVRGEPGNFQRLDSHL